MELCELCQAVNFKYSCPRCNVKYCSLDCYRSAAHSQCSEAFYKESVIKELQNNETIGDKSKVLEMLQRLEDDDNYEEEELDSDDDSAENDDLAARLDEVDLNDADAIWEKLTDTEKQQFKSIVYNNEIDKIITSAELWWRQEIPQNVVVDVEEWREKLKEIQQNCPKVQENVLEFSKVSSKPPAKCLIYNVACVIASYTYIVRLYNGDHASYALEAVNNFISICDNIKSNANFESVPTIVDSIILNCHNHQLYADSNTKSLMLEDLEIIFCGPENIFLLSSVSDVIELFQSVKQKIKTNSKIKPKKPKSFSSEFPENHENFEIYKELQNQVHFSNCVKKLEFYLSFLKHRYNSSDYYIKF